MKNIKQLLVIALSIIGSAKAVAESIKIHALHAETYSCSEHWEGQFKWVGDALGADCIIMGEYEDDTRMFFRPYQNNGFKNEDWFW